MSFVLPSPSIQMARSLPQLQPDQLPHMTAFDLFRQQLESGSVEAAVDAMKRLGCVAVLCGPQQCQDELLPYLTQLALQPASQPAPAAAATATGTAGAGGGATSVVEQAPVPVSDELLLILGQQLPSVAAVLSDPHKVPEFLPLLERLAGMEETVVRDQAVVVLNELCHRSAHAARNNNNSGSGSNNNGNIAAQVPVWMALVKRLAGADWFTAKVSCAGVVAAVFDLVKASDPQGPQGGGGGTLSQQYELLALYKELIQDDTPMVRRAAAQHLGGCLQTAGWPQRDFGAVQVAQLCHDEQDSVRLLAVASMAQAGPEYSEHPTWTVQHWLPILKDGSTDMSWRVRNNLAKHFSETANILGIQGNRQYQPQQSLVMACFVAMLTDAEAEVRASAVTHLARMVAWGGPANFETHLRPLLPALADDVVMEVRSKCALAVMDAAHGGTLEDAVILQAFGPLLESFLQDEFHEVQLQVLGNLHKISHLLPGLSGVVTALLQMSKNSNWRVRQAVAKLLPHLAEARGLDFFNTVLLEPAWLPLLLDSVASVRNSIVDGMGLLVRVTGQEFLQQTLLPHHVRIYNQNANTYLVRITILRAHVETAAECRTGPLFDETVAQILRGLSDKVPNVRMVAAHGLQKVVGGGEADAAVVAGQIRPALEAAVRDESDDDCRLACQKALDHVAVGK